MQDGPVGGGRQILLLVQEGNALQLAVRVKYRRVIKHREPDTRDVVLDVGELAGGHTQGLRLVVHQHGDKVELILKLAIDPPGQIFQRRLSLGGVDGGRIPECERLRAQLQRGYLVLPRFDDDGGLRGHRHHGELRRRAGDTAQIGGNERHPLAQTDRLPPAARGIADGRDGRRIGGPEGGLVVRHILVAAIGEGGHGLILHLVPHHHGGIRWRHVQAGHHGG
ncbi:hypothetical protein D3C75_462750 [compost metagenome]